VFILAPANVSIPLRIVQHTELNSWKIELQHEQATRFTATRSPLVRAVLYEYEDRSVIILSAHHSIADGRSLSYVIHDLLNTMDGKLAQSNTIPLATDDHVGLLMKDLYEPSTMKPILRF
jgi:hypothetical protein